MSLREAIKLQHDAAEAHPLTALLLSGDVDKNIYADLLYNQTLIYQAIENRLNAEFDYFWLADVKRQDAMRQDLSELEAVNLTLFQSTLDAIARITSIDSRSLHAHLYVNHLADMYGGQILKRSLPGSCKRYEFEDRAACIERVRSVLDDDLSDEAVVAFSHALKLLDDVARKYNIFSSD